MVLVAQLETQMINKFFKLFFCLLVASSSAHSSERPIQLSDLSFLVGSWVSPEGSAFYEETWFTPYEGVMSGMFRWPGAGGSNRYVLELLTFVETKSGVTFYFKHFDPNLDAWEQVANTYRVVAVSEGCAHLELMNENRNVPQAMRYCLLEDAILEFRGVDANTPIEESDLVLRFERRSGL